MRAGTGLRVLLGAATVFIISTVCTPAWADGKYFPPVAYPAAPTIPVQRAIISWRNGTETLAVESAMNTPAPEVGWVLPLPAEPNRLAVADPGLLASMSASQRPKMFTDHRHLWEILEWILIGLGGPLLIWALHIKSRIAEWTLIILYLLVLAVMYLSMATLGMGGLSSGVLASSDIRVGNYTANVLHAKSADALNEWLSGNGLKQLDAGERRIIDDYIGEGWCFVVARIRKDIPNATPHPILVSFAATSPIYPMKLTAGAGAITRVELFVIADQQAAAEGFKCVAADKYLRWVRDTLPEVAPCYAGQSQELIIGNPDIGELMWQGCAVTALKADMTPQQMSRDVSISFQPLRPTRQWFCTESGRANIAVYILAYGLVAILLGILFCFGYGRTKRMRLRGPLSCFAIVLLAAAVCWVALPVIPGQDVRLMRRWEVRKPWDDRYYFKKLVEDGKMGGTLTPAGLANIVSAMLPGKYGYGGGHTNPFTGQDMKFERTPGNYSLRDANGLAIICFYDIDGLELQMPTGLKAATQPATEPAAERP